MQWRIGSVSNSNYISSDFYILRSANVVSLSLSRGCHSYIGLSGFTSVCSMHACVDILNDNFFVTSYAQGFRRTTPTTDATTCRPPCTTLSGGAIWTSLTLLSRQFPSRPCHFRHISGVRLRAWSLRSVFTETAFPNTRGMTASLSTVITYWRLELATPLSRSNVLCRRARARECHRNVLVCVCVCECVRARMCPSIRPHVTKAARRADGESLIGRRDFVGDSFERSIPLVWGGVQSFAVSRDLD